MDIRGKFQRQKEVVAAAVRKSWYARNDDHGVRAREGQGGHEGGAGGGLGRRRGTRGGWHESGAGGDGGLGSTRGGRGEGRVLTERWWGGKQCTAHFEHIAHFLEKNSRRLGIF